MSFWFSHARPVMSRSQYERSGLKLPTSLQEQLGLNAQGPGDRTSKPARNVPLGRKAQRKVDRHKKRHHGATATQRSRPRVERVAEYEVEFDKDSPPPKKKQRREQSHQIRTRTPKTAVRQTKSAPHVLRTSDSDLDEGFDSAESFGSERSQSPGLVLDKNSRAYKDRLARDDDEIAALEKRLGLKGKKRAKDADDDLAYFLGGLDAEQETEMSRNKREAAEWLQEKRRKTSSAILPVQLETDKTADSLNDDIGNSGEDFDSADEDNFTEDLDGESEDESDGLVSDIDEGLTDGENEFENPSSADEQTSIAPKKRENPYVAPVVPGAAPAAGKYVPPSLRGPPKNADESLQRLRRQVQGQINKLSEANILSIVGEVEKLYQNNPRQDVTTTILDMLLAVFSDRAQLQNTFVILHAAFVAALYKVIGTDFGAEIIVRWVAKFEEFYKPMETSTDKATVNLISLLSQLYVFGVVSSLLVFDYIRLFLSAINEANTELLLRVVRDCGPQLRQDDPSSLKDIVILMQGTVAKSNNSDQPASVRTKFMIETITDLKNNKLKAGAAGTPVALEHITRMRKMLGSLGNSRTVRGSEPLRISLADIQNSDKRGKWWLVGASWREAEEATVTQSQQSIPDGMEKVDQGEFDLISLAQQHRMNTSVRRSIFIAIMSASDFKDAHLRLMKLRLKKAQELEIPRVLLHCSAAEDAYNPYYTLISKQLCSDSKKLRMSFQFALWSFFKRLGESTEDDHDDDENDEPVELNEIVNSAKMYSHLVTEGVLPVTCLKTLNLLYLKEQGKMFVEVFLVTLVTRSQTASKGSRSEKTLVKVFGPCREQPQFTKGLQYFVKKVLRKTDLVSSKKEMKNVKWACDVIGGILNGTLRQPGLPSEDEEGIDEDID